MKDLKNATVHLKIALGSNMNVSSLTPLAITEIMEDYHQAQLKLLVISGVRVSFEEGYEKGWREATTEACQEIAKNYQPMKRPKIKDFFHEKTDLETVHSEYTKSPHLYSYASDLDRYIDDLEEQLKT